MHQMLWVPMQIHYILYVIHCSWKDIPVWLMAVYKCLFSKRKLEERDHGIVDIKQGRFVCHFPECNIKLYHARKLTVHCSQEHDLTINKCVIFWRCLIF